MAVAGTTVKAGEPIAIYVHDKEAYMEFFADQKENAEIEEKIHGNTIT